MMTDKALVTILIGEEYKQFWQNNCQKSWEQYANKHNYDIVLIEEPIQEDSRTAHWQKLLIFEHPKVKKYDRVAWVDADIVINFAGAPCVFEATEEGTIGVVSRRAKMTDEKYCEVLEWVQKNNIREAIQENAPMSIEERYEKAGLEGDVNDSCNAGLMVLEPKHREILERVYENYEANPLSSKENQFLSYEIFKYGNLTRLNPRFNTIFEMKLLQHYPFTRVQGENFSMKTLAYIVNTIFYNSYFLHFIQGETRQFINLVVTEDERRKSFGYVQSNIPDTDYVVGKHTISANN
jgi:alpha-N-acetylglucosamine transferase